MQPYVATKQWKDGFGAGETRITAADLIRIENGISAATQGVTNVETSVKSLETSTTQKLQQASTQALEASRSLLPAGAISMFAGTNAPSGWLLCNGASYNRTQYPTLFQAIGTVYGSNTSTTFRVPDLRGRFPAGAGGSYAVGATGGSDNVTLTINQIPSHTHGVTAEKFSQGVGMYQSNLGSGSGWQSLSTTESGSSSALITKAVGGSQSHENRPPFLAVTYIIKAL